MSKLMDADRAISGIFYNHPRWPSTFGECVNKCGNIGRGSGKCGDCYEKELAEIVGKILANKFHESVKVTSNLWGEISDRLEGE